MAQCHSGDELDWFRAKNSWGCNQGKTIFGTPETATRFYIMVGTGTKLAPEASALLVSDPVQCQEGDGQISFRYWTSPWTQLRVCTRKPNQGKKYDWCSAAILTSDPGPACVSIPGSIMCEFEIVIEASHFNYDAFGYQGGVVVLDDITYTAQAVSNCKNVPHYDPPQPVSQATCLSIYCTFDPYAQQECLNKVRETDWRISEQPLGHTRCIYSLKSQGPIRAFSSGTISVKPHQWQCRQINLEAGYYDSLDFSVLNCPNDYAYVGLDSIRLLDPSNWQNFCTQQLGLASQPPKYGVYSTSLMGFDPLALQTHNVKASHLNSYQSGLTTSTSGYWPSIPLPPPAISHITSNFNKIPSMIDPALSVTDYPAGESAKEDQVFTKSQREIEAWTQGYSVLTNTAATNSETAATTLKDQQFKAYSFSLAKMAELPEQRPRYELPDLKLKTDDKVEIVDLYDLTETSTFAVDSAPQIESRPKNSLNRENRPEAKDEAVTDDAVTVFGQQYYDEPSQKLLMGTALLDDSDVISTNLTDFLMLMFLMVLLSMMI
uniref:MAM domain-containing protein n=1 Tax=Ditylenchus dipsaci TaxID=166011 RepID=A0A915DN91_9BILA